MSKRITQFRINGLISDRQYIQLPFGHRLEYAEQIRQFKESAHKIHLSKKRQSYKKAIDQALGLYCVTQYYCSFDRNDDSFEFYYK